MPNQEFEYTGTWQRWNIPKKVEWVDIDVLGAGSGEVRGGRVTGRINVKGRDSLYVLVGERGRQNGDRTVGGGGASGQGGSWSGGGASLIRANSRTGALKAVAGGAGGAAGDDGRGGRGGAEVGEAGYPSPGYPDGVRPEPERLPDLWVYPTVGNATGGTQVQGGNGGQSSYAEGFDGEDAENKGLGRAGDAGRNLLSGNVPGGGGGGGYRSGGGGQSGLMGVIPAGGGGGGSNYTEPLTGETSVQGGGASGNGRVVLSWIAPAPANQPPSAPTEVKVGGKDYNNDMPTLSKGKLEITAKISDPNSKKVRLAVYYSPDSSFRQRQVVFSDFVERGKRAKVTLRSLSRDTLWHARLYTRDASGMLSRNYTSLRLWTNRSPAAPELQNPGDNATVTSLNSIRFEWAHKDPDHSENPRQSAFTFQWRRGGSPVQKPGDWQEKTYETDDETYVGDPDNFKANNFYEWRVRTRDEQGSWGAWSEIRSLFVSGSTAPPWARSPVRGEAIDRLDPVVFEWNFRSPTPGSAQEHADVRYRAVDSGQWITMLGTTIDPGPLESWRMEPGALPPGHYEWEARTESSTASLPSDWSDTERFWVVDTPGAVMEDVVPRVVVQEARLGCGNNVAHIYRRGGRLPVGTLAASDTSTIEWTRRRDDISTATIRVDGYRNAGLLRDINSWTHEVVIHRDGERVWEGPITQWSDDPANFVIHAKDVLGFVYRRIMRQGYNDAYRIVNNVQLGQRTVVQRGRQIVMNALAPDDPNVLGYLTSLDFPDDAKQSRSVPDFSKQAWEELDDLAATAGLDYTVVGRRVILWDTHRAIGRLPEMRSEHFSSPPIVTEYGMLLATDFGVSNNNGVYGVATRRKNEEVGPYGLVEQLASAYGEAEAGGTIETLTSEGQAELERTLTLQAERNIASRWPTPMIVRVPDNSTLNPETPVSINHLVPGVWIPLRAKGAVREMAQWQKLDSVTVTQDKDGEKVAVVMSPAPNRGEDPDAEVSVIE